MKPRIEVIDQIVSDMLQGPLDRGVSFTADELLSAVFTLLKRTCDATIKRSPDPDHTRRVLQNQLQQILLDVAPAMGRVA